ncbi:MAG: alpha/beta fold hydrolase [Aestuariivita sp.]|nr:alpha/beta fold hydrolase [Aestuariivita sp.]
MSGSAQTDWPLSDVSRHVFCEPHRWYVVETGKGPTLLLLHGAGSSSHSFRHLIPILSKSYHVVAFDLPGQGQTQLGARHRCGLDAMSADCATLIKHERWDITAIIGHSAGAVLALQLSQNIKSLPIVIGINPALDNFRGLAGILYPVIAKALSLTPGVPYFFSRTSNNPRRVKTLIDGTGSRIDSEGLEYYRRLMSNRDHVNGTLLMMSQWPVDGLQSRWPEFTAPTLLLAAENDKTVSPSVARAAARQIPQATFWSLKNLGHLAHEEEADTVATHILKFLEISLA